MNVKHLFQILYSIIDEDFASICSNLLNTYVLYENLIKYEDIIN